MERMPRAEEPEPSVAVQLLAQWREGDRGALEQLYQLVDAQLRRIARSRLRHLRAVLRAQGELPSLQTTQIVNDAFLILVGRDGRLVNRAHFLAIAAHKMRTLCREYARRALAAKRHPGGIRLTLEDASLTEPALASDPLMIIAIDRALEQLNDLDPEQAEIVKLRFYAGCTDAEVAEAMGISESTVRRRWRSARAFLRRAIGA